jgi:hypothetical protein
VKFIESGSGVSATRYSQSSLTVNVVLCPIAIDIWLVSGMVDWENIFPAVELSLAAPHCMHMMPDISIMDLPASRKVSRAVNMMVSIRDLAPTDP